MTDTEATIARLTESYIDLVRLDGGSAREVGAATVAAALTVAGERHQAALLEHVARQTEALETIAAALTQLAGAMHDARESGNPEPKPKPTDAFANLRERFGAYFDAIPDVDAFVKEQRSGDEWPRPLPGVEPTPDEWAQRVNARLNALDASVSQLTERSGDDSANWLDASGAPAALEARNWQRVNMPAAPATPYTLTPWPESVDARLNRLDLELSRLREANEYLAGRVTALEADGRTWRATLEAQGDALQLLTLRGAP